MLKKSIKLALTNRIILLWSLFHTISMVFIAFAAFTVPMYMFSPFGAYNVFEDISMAMFAVLSIFTLITMFVFTPAGLQYIYELSSDSLSEDWFSKGIRRNWYKVLSVAVVGAVICFFVGLFSYMTLFVIHIVYAGYITSRLTVYTAEDSFREAQQTEKKIRKKYLLKLQLIHLIPYLFSLGLYYGMKYLITMQGVEFSPTEVLYTVDIYLIIIVLVFGIAANAVAYVYSMASYMALNQPAETIDEVNNAVEESAASI